MPVMTLPYPQGSALSQPRMPRSIEELNPNVDPATLSPLQGYGARSGGRVERAAPPPARQAPAQGGALPQSAPQPAGGAVTTDQLGEMDPELKRRVVTESAEAARNTSPEDKQRVNQGLTEAFGPRAIVDGYKEILEALGGEDVVGDMKLSKQDWGLFMMDFGLRMMAYSGSGETLGGAIGRAGTDTIGGILAQKRGLQEQTAASNAERKNTAAALTGELLEDRTRNRTTGNILWTDKGAFDLTTGQALTHEDGSPMMEPASQSGAGRGQFAKQWEIDALMEQGWSADAAFAMAQGAMHPAEVAGRAEDMVAQQIASTGGLTVNNTFISRRRLTDADIERFIQDRVRRYTEFYNYKGAGAGPALTPPGPQAEGRQ
jgi:hypothetical protein